MTATVSHSSLRPARLVSAVASVVGLCILGDSLLYSILPLEADRLGIPLTLVGVLLSVNRLIRLATNGWASLLFERWGPRSAFLFACCLGIASTALYGVSRGFLLFLAARLLWGTAWSALRQGGYQAVWSGDVAHKGRLTGLLWGIVRLGSALAVLAGGFLYDRYGFTTTILIVVAASTLALPIAYFLRWPTELTAAARQPLPTDRPGAASLSQRWRGWRQDLASALAHPAPRWLTIAGGLQLLSSSVVISTSSLVLASLAGSEQAISWLGVATVTGLLQGTRWLSDITVGPTLGYLSDRLGQANLAGGLILISLISMIGLWRLSAVAAIVCLLIVLLCDSGLSVILNAAASGVAVHTERPHLYMGVYATATDLGSALGPLFALSIGQTIGFSTLYLSIGVLCACAIFYYRYLTRQPAQPAAA